jgi:hypothetical protein
MKWMPLCIGTFALGSVGIRSDRGAEKQADRCDRRQDRAVMQSSDRIPASHGGWSARRERITPGAGQMPARRVEIGQRRNHEQAMQVPLEPAVTHLGEAEHPLDDPDRMLDLGPNLRLGAVLGPLDLVYDAAMAIAAVDEVARPRSAFADHRPLAAIGLVAPHAGLVAVQQRGQYRAVGDIGGRRHHRLDRLSTPKCALMPKYHWLPFLVWGISAESRALALILGRGRRADDRGVDDRAAGNRKPVCRQMPLHFIKQPPAQTVRLQQVAKAAHLV